MGPGQSVNDTSILQSLKTMASSWSSDTESNSDKSDTNILEFEVLNSLKDFIGSEPFGQYLSEYINNTLSNIDRLGYAIASEDEERVKQFSHKLKGSAGNIGATKLSAVCTQMQPSLALACRGGTAF